MVIEKDRSNQPSKLRSIMPLSGAPQQHHSPHQKKVCSWENKDVRWVRFSNSVWLRTKFKPTERNWCIFFHSMCLLTYLNRSKYVLCQSSSESTCFEKDLGPVTTTMFSWHLDEQDLLVPLRGDSLRRSFSFKSFSVNMDETGNTPKISIHIDKCNHI